MNTMKSVDWMTSILWAFLLLSIASTGYFFFYSKDYDVMVETACSPDMENCFHRDCSAEDSECPPNGYEDYKVYAIKAYDFASCEADTCNALCLSGSPLCVETTCGAVDTDTCSSNPEESSQ
ncbi:MAG: hypothetical protein AAB472_02245 [Patescibacteria group bacterium]